MQEQIQGLRKSVAGIGQRLQAPKTWLASESVNVLQVRCDLLDLVQQMNTQLTNHPHVPGPTPTPADLAVFTENASNGCQRIYREGRTWVLRSL